jgi:hypothetical protein
MVKAAGRAQLLAEKIIEHADALILGDRRALERCVDQLEAEKSDSWNVGDILRGACSAKTQDDSNCNDRKSHGVAAALIGWVSFKLLLWLSQLTLRRRDQSQRTCRRT